MGNLFLDLGPFTPPTDMLLLLSLLSVASASPLHHYYYGSYNPYVSHYYNVPAVYQVNPNAVYGVDPSFRGSWPITVAAVMQEKATFSAAAADATATPAVLAMSAKTLTGTVSIKQNTLTFNRGKYTIYLANAPASTKYRIGVAAGCDDTAAAAGMTLTEITTPPILVNGAWIAGVSTTHNLNGGDSKVDLTGMMVTVFDIAANSYTGCSSAIA